MKKRLCVFCGSSSGRGEKYLEMANQLGKILVQKNIGLVYGGATIGVMGAIADSVLQDKGEVIGVIPHHLVDYEIAHRGLTELHEVEDMHIRKKIMYDKSDYFLVLPGGLGTLDEMFEILTWSQLKLHSKPCYLFNFNSFYDSLLLQLKHATEEGFLKKEHFELLKVVNNLEEIANFL